MTTVTGGLLKKPMVIPIIECHVGDVKQEFVHVNSKQDWLCRAVTGERMCVKPMKRVKLLQTLVNHIDQQVAGNFAPSDADAVAVAANDPMNSLDFDPIVEEHSIDDTDDKKQKKKSNKNKKTNAYKHSYAHDRGRAMP